MKKFKYEFEINDDFEKGDCHNCPFQEWEWYDDDGYSDCYSKCVIGECLIEEIKED